MKKRLISLALSAITAVSAVSSLNAGAIPNQLFDEERFADYIKLEGCKWIRTNNDTIALYMDYRDSYVTFYDVVPMKDSIKFTFTDISAITELEGIIAEIDENLQLTHSKQPKNGLYNCTIYSSEIEVDTAKKIREAIGEKTNSFEYMYNQLSYSSAHFNHMTGYALGHYDENYNVIMDEDILKEYVESNNIDAEVVVYSEGDTDSRGDLMSQSMIHIVPNKELAPLEHFQLANEIFEATGICPLGFSPTTPPESTGTTFDLTNYLNGDANCDNVQSMADAASIFQAIGNPDKYSLSDLGQFNADYAGDGLTPDDAIAIQKRLAGIE